MIKITRGPAPAPLSRWAPRWTQALLEALDAYKRGSTGAPPDHLWNKYNKSYIRTALEEMFHSKCAYCESKIGDVSFPRIDHYRPKGGGYAHLTFAWDNLLLTCEKCNHNKGDQFPLQNEDEAAPLLLNPCDDDPAEHITFEGPRLVHLSDRGQATTGLLKLNRDELFDSRRAVWELVRFIYLAIRQHEQDPDPKLAQQGRSLLEELSLLPTSEYTAMVSRALRELEEQAPAAQ